MTYLKIDNKRVFFKTNIDSEYQKLEDITPNDIKDLLSLAYELEEFEIDILEDENILANPVEKIVYGHLRDKIVDLRETRIAAIQENVSTYSKILEEYEKEE